MKNLSVMFDNFSELEADTWREALRRLRLESLEQIYLLIDTLFFEDKLRQIIDPCYQQGIRLHHE